MARTSKALKSSNATKKSAVKASASNAKTEASKDCSAGRKCSKNSTTKSCS